MAKTFLGKILASILEVFKANFPEFVKRLYKKIPDEIKAELAIIVFVVEKLKDFVDSPTADLITEMTKWELDDDLKDWLRKVLPVLLKRLSLLNGLSTDKDVRNCQLHNVATLLTQELTGVPFGQAVVTSEIAYLNS